MTKRKNYATGERNGNHTLSDKARAAIRRSMEPAMVLAARYGVDKSTINRIRHAK